MSIDKAKEMLRQAGYLILEDITIEDIMSTHKCTREQAMKVADEVMDSETTHQDIWENIEFYVGELL